jgi:type I restriction-modification system, S subunit
MTPEQLKASILQRAMEGKLVPQDPNDEPASELLKRIKAEKEKLIKEGKIKRDKNETEIFRGDDGLHYEKFQDGSVLRIDVPFEIPESWEWVNLGQVGTLQRGAGIKKSETVSKGIQCVRYGEIYTTYDYFFTETVSSTTSDVAKRSLAVNADDILITLTGENKKDIGKAVAYLGNASCVMGGDLSKLSNHKMNAKYLSLVLNSPNVKAQKSELATGNIIVHISNSKLEKILVPIPPIKEQREIVDKVEYYFSFVDEYKIAQNKLKKINDEFPEKLQKSILQYAMQGKLVPQDATDEPVEVLLEKIREEKQKLFEEGKLKKKDLQESIIYQSDDGLHYEKFPDGSIKQADVPYDIPESWEWVKIKSIYWNRKQGKPEKDFYYIDTTAIDNINQSLSENIDKISFENAPSRARKNIEVGDVLFGTVRPYLKNIAIFDKKNDYYVASTAFIVMTPILVKNNFLVYALLSPKIQTVINQKSSGSNYPAINDTNFQELFIPIPPLQEQVRINKRLSELLKRIDQYSYWYSLLDILDKTFPEKL